jgi:hypothetical protein
VRTLVKQDPLPGTELVRCEILKVFKSITQ